MNISKKPRKKLGPTKRIELNRNGTTVLIELIDSILKADDSPTRLNFINVLTEYTEHDLPIFNSYYRTIIKSITETFNAPTPFYIAGILSALSTAIGKNITIQDSRNVTEKAALYLCVVSPSGTGKTPALNWCIEPIKKIESKNHKEHLLKKQEAEDNEEQFKDDYKTHYLTDTTIEALTTQLSRTNSILYFRDELIGWLKDMNKYRQTGSDDLLFMQIWNSNDTIRVERQTKSIFVENPYLNVLGGTQPRRLNDFLTKTATDSGFFQRILFVYPDSEIQDRTDHAQDLEVKESYQNSIKTIFENCEAIDPTVLTMTKESNDYINNFVNSFIKKQQRANAEPLHVEILSKLETYVLRFSLVYHIADTEGQDLDRNVSHDAVIRAVATTIYFYSQSVKVLESSKQNQSPYDNDSDRIIHTILSKHLKTGDLFTTANALQLTQKHVSKPTLLKHLKTAKFYDKVSRGNYEFL